ATARADISDNAESGSGQADAINASESDVSQNDASRDTESGAQTTVSGDTESTQAGEEYTCNVYVNYRYELDTDFFNAAPGETLSLTVIDQKTGEDVTNLCTWEIASEKESAYGALTSSDTGVSEGTVAIGEDETCTLLCVTATTPAGSTVEGTVKVDY
ncbi:MAG: hypothetical protein LUF30_08030, partial [Lachnospiraceae bacterium]|nr:hypothetical protein [Lachnospiraceae bacterium]